MIGMGELVWGRFWAWIGLGIGGWGLEEMWVGWLVGFTRWDGMGWDGMGWDGMTCEVDISMFLSHFHSHSHFYI